jgi:excisionase family DNA binding protein
MNSIKVVESGLLTRKQAAAYLNVSERWMQRARAHNIPFIKMGKSVYFTIPDLEKYIARNRIGGEM